MAKKSMKMKYKSPKRERNKKQEVETSNEFLSFIKITIGVLVVIGIMYLLMLGMEKIGLFDAGYVPLEKEETTIDNEYIPIGTVFNRNEKSYYVIFDNYKNEYSHDSYVNSLLADQTEYRVYKVDMSLNENEEYKSEESNSKATKVSDLKINDITLILIKNGKISKYLTGSEDIEEYLSK